MNEDLSALPNATPALLKCARLVMTSSGIGEKTVDVIGFHVSRKTIRCDTYIIDAKWLDEENDYEYDEENDCTFLAEGWYECLASHRFPPRYMYTFRPAGASSIQKEYAFMPLSCELRVVSWEQLEDSKPFFLKRNK